MVIGSLAQLQHCHLGPTPSPSLYPRAYPESIPEVKPDPAESRSVTLRLTIQILLLRLPATAAPRRQKLTNPLANVCANLRPSLRRRTLTAPKYPSHRHSTSANPTSDNTYTFYSRLHFRGDCVIPSLKRGHSTSA